MWNKNINNRRYRLITAFISGIMFLLSIVFVACETYDFNEPTKVETETGNTNNDSNSNDGSNTSNENKNDDNDNIEGENLLKNGGLEEWSSFWTPEMPDEWSLPSNAYAKQNRSIVYEGYSSAKMQSQEKGNTARLEQEVQVTPREIIRIRFHYFVEQWKAKGARTYCYFRTRSAESSTISADELKAFYDKKTYYIIRGGGYGLTYLPHDLNVWQVFDETIEVPPTATYFVFGVNSYYGTTIYIDDCWVIEK